MIQGTISKLTYNNRVYIDYDIISVNLDGFNPYIWPAFVAQVTGDRYTAELRQMQKLGHHIEVLQNGYFHLPNFLSLLDSYIDLENAINVERNHWEKYFG